MLLLLVRLQTAPTPTLSPDDIAKYVTALGVSGILIVGLILLLRNTLQTQASVDQRIKAITDGKDAEIKALNQRVGELEQSNQRYWEIINRTILATQQTSGATADLLTAVRDALGQKTGKP